LASTSLPTRNAPLRRHSARADRTGYADRPVTIEYSVARDTPTNPACPLLGLPISLPALNARRDRGGGTTRSTSGEKRTRRSRSSFTPRPRSNAAPCRTSPTSPRRGRRAQPPPRRPVVEQPPTPLIGQAGPELRTELRAPPRPGYSPLDCGTPTTSGAEAHHPKSAGSSAANRRLSSNP